MRVSQTDVTTDILAAVKELDKNGTDGRTDILSSYLNNDVPKYQVAADLISALYVGPWLVTAQLYL